METKIVVNDPKTGKSYTKTLSEDEAAGISGKRIGEETDLSFLGMDGYSGIMTGGSYMTGTPMRREIDGIGLKKVLVNKGVGNKSGKRLRRSVAGNTVSQFTSQVNISITKYGEKPLDQVFEAKKE